MAVQKFAVQVPQATLDDLHRRLESVRWPDEMPGARWDFGTDLGYLKSFVAYWRRSYDWRRQEAALNRLPQYRVGIDGFHVHVPLAIMTPQTRAKPVVLP